MGEVLVEHAINRDVAYEGEAVTRSFTVCTPDTVDFKNLADLCTISGSDANDPSAVVLINDLTTHKKAVADASGNCWLRTQ
jgi:hypothetical protein